MQAHFGKASLDALRGGVFSEEATTREHKLYNHNRRSKIRNEPWAVSLDTRHQTGDGTTSTRKSIA